MRFTPLVALLVCLAASVAAAQTTVLSPNEALRERVEHLREDPNEAVQGGVSIAAVPLLPRFYANRGFAPAWGSSQAREELLRAVRDAALDGLDPEDYHASALERLRAASEQPGAPEALWIDYDIVQTDALARLLYHLLFGKVDPRAYAAQWNYERSIHLGDPARFVQGVIDAPSLYAAVDAEKPHHQLYLDLRAQLARYRGLRNAGGWSQVPPGPALKPGMRDPRVGALRARLEKTGQLAEDAASGPVVDLYDPAVEAAVRAAQEQYGLTPDGVAGAALLAALNFPLEARIAQLEVNLEYCRWLLHDLDPTFVIVNVAGFRVYFVRDNALVWTTRAQVGKPYRQTPIFRSELSYLVLNPTWTVPPGIFAKDVLPGMRRDPGYIAKRGLQLVDAQGRAVTAAIDWSKVTPRGFPYSIRQAPGPDNALGRIKFMFPNPYSVYMHDTPHRELFQKSDRAFSSGCIRIENPLDLAVLLLAGQPGWGRAAIEAAIATGDMHTVPLQREVPVLLYYLTAWVEPGGTLQLRGDVYGRDAKALRALREPFRLRPLPRGAIDEPGDAPEPGTR